MIMGLMLFKSLLEIKFKSKVVFIGNNLFFLIILFTYSFLLFYLPILSYYSIYLFSVIIITFYFFFNVPFHSYSIYLFSGIIITYYFFLNLPIFSHSICLFLLIYSLFIFVLFCNCITEMRWSLNVILSSPSSSLNRISLYLGK